MDISTGIKPLPLSNHRASHRFAAHCIESLKNTLLHVHRPRLPCASSNILVGDLLTVLSLRSAERVSEEKTENRKWLQLGHDGSGGKYGYEVCLPRCRLEDPSSLYEEPETVERWTVLSLLEMPRETKQQSSVRMKHLKGVGIISKTFIHGLCWV